jgi:hypothetical protein
MFRRPIEAIIQSAQVSSKTSTQCGPVSSLNWPVTCSESAFFSGSMLNARSPLPNAAVWSPTSAYVRHVVSPKIFSGNGAPSVMRRRGRSELHSRHSPSPTVTGQVVAEIGASPHALLRRVLFERSLEHIVHTVDPFGHSVRSIEERHHHRPSCGDSFNSRTPLPRRTSPFASDCTPFVLYHKTANQSA